MKPTAFYRWLIPDDAGKLRPTRYRMSEQTARERYGDQAQPLLDTIEWRDLPESAEEVTQHNPSNWREVDRKKPS